MHVVAQMLQRARRTRRGCTEWRSRRRPISRVK